MCKIAAARSPRQKIKPSVPYWAHGSARFRVIVFVQAPAQRLDVLGLFETECLSQVPPDKRKVSLSAMLDCGCKAEEPNGKGVDGDGVFPKVSPRDAVE